MRRFIAVGVNTGGEKIIVYMSYHIMFFEPPQRRIRQILGDTELKVWSVESIKRL